jgi:hypothetical protein
MENGLSAFRHSQRLLDALRKYLNRLGVDAEQRKKNTHPAFGEITDTFSWFLKNRFGLCLCWFFNHVVFPQPLKTSYLDRIKLVSGEIDMNEWRWGPRSKVEFPVKNVMHFITEVEWCPRSWSENSVA